MRRFVLLLIACAATACASAPTRQVVAPAGATTIAPYSPGIRSGDLLFLSGQIGMTGGALVPGGIAAETRQALANMRTILDAAGLTPADVLKCTVFLVDMAEYEAMNAAYGDFFREAPPARSAVAVAALPRNARVEIECISRARQ
ncbi:MAG TPA: Rid family detoxifying hydrolase [Longimicrobiales bacterium]|nr:Rid family detoxifying hydrolase [Longimicrobiales bacterium]